MNPTIIILLIIASIFLAGPILIGYGLWQFSRVLLHLIQKKSHELLIDENDVIDYKRCKKELLNIKKPTEEEEAGFKLSSDEVNTINDINTKLLSANNDLEQLFNNNSVSKRLDGYFQEKSNEGKYLNEQIYKLESYIAGLEDKIDRVKFAPERRRNDFAMRVEAQSKPYIQTKQNIQSKYKELLDKAVDFKLATMRTRIFFSIFFIFNITGMLLGYSSIDELIVSYSVGMGFFTGLENFCILTGLLVATICDFMLVLFGGFQVAGIRNKFKDNIEQAFNDQKMLQAFYI